MESAALVTRENVGWLFEHLFTGAGTVQLAIVAFWLRERGAISADNRKVTFEIRKEERHASEVTRALRGNLVAELTSLQKSALEEIEFVRANTDSSHPAFPQAPHQPFSGTEVPVVGYFKDFQSRYQAIGTLETGEVVAVMAAYYIFVERRNYILINSSVEAGKYKDAVEIGIVPYSFSDPLRVSFLLNELSAIATSCDEALKLLNQVPHRPTAT